jgi:hypothetical protein
VAGSATAVAAATAAIRQKAKVAAVERRASARALILARSRGSEEAECLRSPEPALPELEISCASEEREELGDNEKEQEEEQEEEKEKEPSEEPAEELAEEEEEGKDPEEEDELLLCPKEPESRKEPEGEVEELEGEKKKLELPLPEPNEEEREREYQQMIDKLNNTLSATLARGGRRWRR